MADNAPAQAAARAHVPSTDQGSSSSSAAPPAASAAPRAADSRVAIASNALPPPKLKKSIWEPVDLPHRKAVQDFYNSKPVQYGVAAVILINFCFIVLEKEIDPYSSDVVPNVQKYATLWGRVDDVCNVLFIFELLINFYGNCWGPFVSSSWNYLDMLVVIIGITSLGRIQLPAGVSKIKVFRAFRILRLFKRVQSLNKILVALVRSIPGVMNAFIVMFIFMCIFAIIAVDAFRDFGAQGFYQTVQTYGARDAQWGQGSNMTIVMPFVEGSYVSTENFTYVDAITPRGFHYGQEYFGTFGRSLYTLFQVLTGESWSEMVVRPLIFGVMPENAFWVALFFTVYILLTQVVLQNVVVAVLLDKFTEKDESEEEAPAAAAPSEEPAAADTSSGEGRPPAQQQQHVPDTAPTPSVAGAGTPAVVRAQDVEALQADFARIVNEQAVVKANLQLILSRLNAAATDGQYSGSEGTALSA